MLKRYCDVCNNEMLKSNTPNDGGNGERLVAKIKKPGVDFSVDIFTSMDGATNKGDVCTHCILDALYKLDDRPKQRAHLVFDV